jgi:hypothetical protein
LLVTITRAKQHRTRGVKINSPKKILNLWVIWIS